MIDVAIVDLRGTRPLGRSSSGAVCAVATFVFLGRRPLEFLGTEEMRNDLDRNSIPSFLVNVLVFLRVFVVVFVAVVFDSRGFPRMQGGMRHYSTLTCTCFTFPKHNTRLTATFVA